MDWKESVHIQNWGFDHQKKEYIWNKFPDILEFIHLRRPNQTKLACVNLKGDTEMSITLKKPGLTQRQWFYVTEVTVG